MPELPEVEALAADLRERAVGRVIDRVDVAAIAVLKTYDPPVTALPGATVTGTGRHGKFLDLITEPAGGGPPLHLVIHLARAGWLRWRESCPRRRPSPGKGPLALRVRLDDGPASTSPRQGTRKRLAVYVVRDPAAVPGIARLGPDPLDPEFTPQVLAAILAGPPHPDQGRAARPVGDRRHRQRVLRRGPARGAGCRRSSWPSA